MPKSDEGVMFECVYCKTTWNIPFRALANAEGPPPCPNSLLPAVLAGNPICSGFGVAISATYKTKSKPKKGGFK